MKSKWNKSFGLINFSIKSRAWLNYNQMLMLILRLRFLMDNILGLIPKHQAILVTSGKFLG
jgi:hypothetical protein